MQDQLDAIMATIKPLEATVNAGVKRLEDKIDARSSDIISEIARVKTLTAASNLTAVNKLLELGRQGDEIE